MSCKMCCVVNCSNSYKNTKNKNVKFYNFPNKSYEIDLKKRWITAIKRLDDNGELWYPKPQSFVCSEHFVDNQRSKDPNSPSYIPTLFPDVYKRKLENKQQQSDRYQRKIKRKKKLIAVSNDDEPLGLEIIESCHHPKVSSVCSVWTQVLLDFSNKQFKFECEFNRSNCDVGTLANIPLSSNHCIERTVKDVACGDGRISIWLLYFSNSIHMATFEKFNSFIIFKVRII